MGWDSSTATSPMSISTSSETALLMVARKTLSLTRLILRSFAHDVPIFDHSKIRIDDDRYLAVGTANYNHRSYLYDSEINVSVLDEATAIDARRRVFESLVGEYKAYLSDDPQNNFDVLKAVSDYNGELAEWWATYAEDLSAEQAEQTWADTPFYGYVHPLEFSSNYLEVGPDMF